jgi:hypothetical protein
VDAGSEHVTDVRDVEELHLHLAGLDRQHPFLRLCEPIGELVDADARFPTRAADRIGDDVGRDPLWLVRASARIWSVVRSLGLPAANRVLVT